MLEASQRRGGQVPQVHARAAARTSAMDISVLSKQRVCHLPQLARGRCHGDRWCVTTYSRAPHPIPTTSIYMHHCDNNKVQNSKDSWEMQESPDTTPQLRNTPPPPQIKKKSDKASPEHRGLDHWRPGDGEDSRGHTGVTESPGAPDGESWSGRTCTPKMNVEYLFSPPDLGGGG